MPTSLRENALQRSLRGAGQAKVTALCAALDLPPTQVQAATDLFDLVSQSWGQWTAGNTPNWVNDITDDCTPFELSIGFRGEQTDVRVLFESQPPDEAIAELMQRELRAERDE